MVLFLFMLFYIRWIIVHSFTFLHLWFINFVLGTSGPRNNSGGRWSRGGTSGSGYQSHSQSQYQRQDQNRGGYNYGSSSRGGWTGYQQTNPTSQPIRHRTVDYDNNRFES